MVRNDTIAIDFGTSRTKLAYVDAKDGTTATVELMRHEGDRAYIPSYFAILPSKKIIVGDAAQDMFESADKEERRRATDNVKGEVYKLGIRYGPSKFHTVGPEALLTELFKILRVKAGKKLPGFEHEPESVYLTHPTTFLRTARDILKRSAKAAGFSSVELREEPQAAAEMVAGAGQDLLPNDIIVIDSGAGTLQWQYMHRSKSGRFNQQGGRLRAGGTDKVGGSSVDRVLALELEDQLKVLGVEVTEEDRAFLRHKARLRKEEFCRDREVRPIADHGVIPIKFDGSSLQLTAYRIQEVIQENYIVPACEEVAPYIKDVIKETRSRPVALVLTGGSARLAGFKEALGRAFGLEYHSPPRSEYATVLGAMHCALSDEGNDPRARNSGPHVQGGSPSDTRSAPDVRVDSPSNPKYEVPEGMVLIPAGDFQMGSEEGEQPVHTVHVDAFFMDKYLVTNKEYKKFTDANPEWRKPKPAPAAPSWWQVWERGKYKKEHRQWLLINFKYFHWNYLQDWNGNEYPIERDNYPVNSVSWYAAMAYARWADKRLPTEAEWEKAARGGLSGKKYPWGNTIDSAKANYDRNVGNTTVVGSYPANDYDLYDMGGNVHEWCLDAYDKDFYANSPSANPISGAPTVKWMSDNYTSVTSYRVFRDGSWGCTAHEVRVANRDRHSPEYTSNGYGFRCVRDLSPNLF